MFLIDEYSCSHKIIYGILATAIYVKWRMLVRNQKNNRTSHHKVVPFLQDSRYFYRRGLKAYRERNLSLAARMLHRAVELDPRNDEALCQLSMIYTELGEYQKSNELLIYIIEEMNDGMTECYYFMANNYAHLGLFHEAYKYAQKYAMEDPNGEFSEENADLLEMLEMEGEQDSFSDQEDLIVRQESARQCLVKGQLDQAIHELNELIHHYPDFWSAYNNLALAHFYLGEVETAKKYLAFVLEKNEGNLHALCNLLVFYFYEQKDEEVKKLVEKLSSIYPMLMEHRYKLGATLALVEHYDHAFKWLYSLYKKGFHGDDTFYYWLSYAAYFTGRRDFAIKCWKRVIQENPEKKGSEPWKDEHKITEDLIEKQLYATYVETKEKRAHEFYRQLLHHSNVKKAIEAILSHRRNHHKLLLFAFQVADYLFEKNGHEQLIKTWFHIFILSAKTNVKLQNEKAWAAAVNVWFNKQHKIKETQAYIARKYQISPTTLAKYVKKIKELKINLNEEHG
jgi:tetratricopeptide (TPR) repeat protein